MTTTECVRLTTDTILTRDLPVRSHPCHRCHRYRRYRRSARLAALTRSADGPTGIDDNGGGPAYCAGTAIETRGAVEAVLPNEYGVRPVEADWAIYTGEPVGPDDDPKGQLGSGGVGELADNGRPRPPDPSESAKPAPTAGHGLSPAGESSATVASTATVATKSAEASRDGEPNSLTSGHGAGAVGSERRHAGARA